MGDVRKHKETDPSWYKDLATRYEATFARATKAIACADWATIGPLANEAHQLLSELGVTCKELDVLVNAVRLLYI